MGSQADGVRSWVFDRAKGAGSEQAGSGPEILMVQSVNRKADSIDCRVSNTKNLQATSAFQQSKTCPHPSVTPSLM